METLSPAPTVLDDILEPGWLSAALELPVVGVRVTEVLKTVATKVRFHIDIEGQPEGQDLCLKGFFDEDPLPPSRARSTQNEVRFYTEVAPTLDVNVPVRRYAAIDERSGHGLLIMDDVVAAGGRFLNALDPYSPEQARSSLDQIAALHAAHWGEAGLDRLPWLRDWLADIAATPLMPAPALQALLDDGRSAPLAAAVADAERLHRGLRVLADRATREPRTLVHGDTHAGNLYVLDGKTALIDWQVLQRTTWAIDVAYHIGAALTVEDRRSTEADLLEHYLTTLRSRGVTPPDWDEAWTSYRAGMVYGFYLWAVTKRVTRPVILEFTERLGTAVTDLQSFEELGV